MVRLQIERERSLLPVTSMSFDRPTAQPLHARLQAIVDAAAASLPFSSMSLMQVREQARRNAPTLAAPVSVATVRDVSIPSASGDIPARVYVPDGRRQCPSGASVSLAHRRPADDAAEVRMQAPYPVVVFFHGGGFVVLDVPSHDYLCLRLCAWASCVVVSVDYRLAPEHKFPAAVEDAFIATCWAAAHAPMFGGDPRRLAVAGASSGGCLAAVTALRARDEGGPPLAAQLLFYPVTDHPSSIKASYRDYAEGFGLTAEQMQWFWTQYLPDAATASHPHASPLRSPSFAELPPAHVTIAECDVLHDEAVALADRLAEAGVRTTSRVWPGMNHSFLKLLGQLQQADQALIDACQWLDDIFDRSTRHS